MIDPSLLARVLPFLRPAQLLKLPGVGAVAPLTTSQSAALRIPEDGVLLHIKPVPRLPAGSTVDDYRQAQAQLGVRFVLDQEEFFTDGLAGQFVSCQTFLELPEGFAFHRAVSQNQALSVQYTNQDTALTITPETVIGWIPARELLALDRRLQTVGPVDSRGRY